MYLNLISGPKTQFQHQPSSVDEDIGDILGGVGAGSIAGGRLELGVSGTNRVEVVASLQ